MEKLIAKHNRIIRTDTAIDLTESPAVEFARETRKFGRLEEFRNDLPCEFIRVVDHKRFAVIAPRHAKVVTSLLLLNVTHQDH